MRNVAVILAAGKGERAGGDCPKQFRVLADGRTVLERCVDAFEASEEVNEIVVVTHPAYVSAVQAMLLKCSWAKVSAVIEGGAERWESSWNAVRYLVAAGYAADETNILLHDSARPFVSERILGDVCRALKEDEAVTVAVPVTDTLYIVREGRLTDVPPRSDFLRAQTPQAFRLGVIADAYRQFMADSAHQATDDIGVLRRYCPEVGIRIVAGDEANRKLTYAADFAQ